MHTGNKMSRILMVVIPFALLLTSCGGNSEPREFPPPQGYSSWEEYNSATGQNQTSNANSNPTPPTAASPSEQTTIDLITKDASEISLTLSDFPSGWMLHDEETVESGSNEGYYSRTFVNQEYGLTTPLVCRVQVFSDINSAQVEYNSLLADISSKYSYDEVNYGDEGFAYEETGHGFRCAFREKNVVGIIDMSTFMYGGSLDDTKEYAEKLAEKIY